MENINSIKNWPENERPREIFLNEGPGNVSDAGLIAILLRTGIKGKDAVSFARDLIKQFDGIRGLLNAKKSDLLNIKGLGMAKTSQLLASIELTKRQLKEEIVGKSYIKNEKDVIDYLSLSMRDLAEEFFKVIYLNKANIIIAIEDLQKGTVDQVSIYPRDIIKKALNLNSSGVIFIHNHPSGQLEPSQFDLEITKTLISACLAVDITPLDHIIISFSGYLSLKSKGFMEF